jgi:hypothetical protein
MMTTGIRSIRNQYHGINAHLHSYWQSEGGWHSFHGNHIADLLRSLRAALLPMGYTADLESSLQVRRLDQRLDEPESDVTIFDPHPVRPFLPIDQRMHGSGVLILPVPEVLQEPPLSENEFAAIAIYKLVHRERDQGTPVAWVELLSPANKGGSQDAVTYREKRSHLIHSGLVFVELDYLHESGSTLGRLANYYVRRRQPAPVDAHPYRIAVIDPRPNFDTGKAYIAEFDVEQPIPTVTIPLNGDDALRFNFDQPYQKSYTETLYGLELVDYSQLPQHFDRYSPADQARIANRMVAVLQAARAGVDLETGPFPVGSLSLADALAKLELYKTQ